MELRIIFGLGVIAAVIEGLMPGMVPMDLLPLALVVLGLVYGARSIDAENPTVVLVVAASVGMAAGADVLDHIHVIGPYLDDIVDQYLMLLYGAVIAVMAARAYNRIRG